jgi:ribonuclease P protein component
MELSTGGAPISPKVVDDVVGIDAGRGVQVANHWLGTVVPKRHARRAVTRSLLKRQIRSVFRRHRASLPCGLWVVRLRSQFGRDEFPSAASEALRQAAAEELAALLFRAGQLTPPP